MTKEGSSEFFKEPHSVETQFNTFKIWTPDFAVPKGFERTASAMQNLAKVKEKAHREKKTGINDFSVSLRELLFVFDTFVKDLTKNKNSAGFSKLYTPQNPDHLTINLLWQIRNILTHGGGIVDQKCKDDYEKIMSTAIKNGVSPTLSLPQTIEIGKKFIIDSENYYKVEICVAKYIESKVQKEVFFQLALLCGVSNFRFTSLKVPFETYFGVIQLDFIKADEYGFKFDFEKKVVHFPQERIVYDSNSERIVFVSSGESFSAKLFRKFTLKKGIFPLMSPP